MGLHPDAGGPDDDPVIDLDRLPRPGPPPVVGAQWDELHGCWEVWDGAAESWFLLTDDGRVPRPAPTRRLDFVATQSVMPDESDESTEPPVIDVDRLAAPGVPVRGAQWNEVVGRWERWDEAAGAWVEARADAGRG